MPDTIKMLEAFAEMQTTQEIVAAWRQVIKEIGNTNSDAEIVASVLLAMLRTGKASISMTDLNG